MTARRFLSILLAAGAGAACAKDEPAADTTTVVAESEAPAPATASAAEVHIGRLPVLDALAADGQCSVNTYGGVAAALSAELIFRSRFPTRTVKLALGDSTRPFRPVSLDISVRKEAGMTEEVESLFATFGEDGSIRDGYRQYLTVDNSIPRERRDLLPDEQSDASRIARAVMQQCPPR